ncbi:c-type heme family protein [Thermodesulfovibrio hydrogeniphilus]
MNIKNLSLNTKFTLSIIIIIFVFCIIFSLLLYYHLKQKVIEDANEKTRIIHTQIDALGNYVKEELRPAIFKLLHETGRQNEFIVEGMSTTHVRLSVMKRFNNKIGAYTYKRVSPDPINPEHKPDELHIKLIEYFAKNHDRETWSGIVKWNGQQILITAKPVIVEKGCLICHGKIKDAPQALLKMFPRTRDFNWKEGDVMGVETVSLPIAATLGEIKGIAISTFLFGVVSLIFLFVALQGAFYSFVIKPLKRLSSLFRGIVDGSEPLNKTIEVKIHDEIGELIQSFNQMGKYLYEAQEAIKKYAETLQTIFEGITDPLALINRDCSVEMTNHAYRVWIKEGRAAVFSSPCDLQKVDADKPCPLHFLKRVIDTKKPLSEYWEGDDEKYYFVHFYPIFDEKSEVVKVVHYVKDITEKMKIEEQMRITEKLAAIGQLSAGLAHEINNPLGGIRLCLHNLTSTEMDEETRKMHIEVINQGLLKIQEIIKQLLDFSKQTELIISKVNVNSLVENVLKLTDYLISKKQIKVVKNFATDMPEIMVDPNKIEQVFLNIVLNAIQAMDSGEKILTITTYTQNGKCYISFKDTGPGVPSEILPKIFDPFFTTKPVGQGTGLGLSVSKSIVEQHNGRILVDTSSKGTTFTVELPIQG